MARERREEIDSLQDRLYRAYKRKEEIVSWTFELEWLHTAVRTHESLGFKTGLKYNATTKKLEVVAYKEVAA
jgi:hypothetical protein